MITPYDPTKLTMLISEVLVNSDQATAVVKWSQPYNGATARAVGSTITLPTGLGTGQAGTYLVLGETNYNYTPLSIFTPAAALTLHDSIYLTPRQSTSISCTDCTTTVDASGVTEESAKGAGRAFARNPYRVIRGLEPRIRD